MLLLVSDVWIVRLSSYLQTALLLDLRTGHMGIADRQAGGSVASRFGLPAFTRNANNRSSFAHVSPYLPEVGGTEWDRLSRRAGVMCLCPIKRDIPWCWLPT